MQRNWKLRNYAATLLAIVLSMSVLSGFAIPTLQAQTNSVPVSQPQATPVSQDEALRAACADALTELVAARKLLQSQDALIEKQDELLALEGKLSTGLKNLRTLDAEEKGELRKAIDAANRQIAALEAQVAVLKKNRATFWKKFKWVVIGGAAGIIAGAVLTND